jgi:hypothetical protein
MKTQLIRRQPLQQQPPNPKPERIAAGQHHRRLSGIEAPQLLKQWLRLIAGDQSRSTITSPALQGGVQTAGSCHQCGLAQQLLVSRRQAGRCAGVGADHLNHLAIVSARRSAEERKLPYSPANCLSLRPTRWLFD